MDDFMSFRSMVSITSLNSLCERTQCLHKCCPYAYMLCDKQSNLSIKLCPFLLQGDCLVVGDCFAAFSYKFYDIFGMVTSQTFVTRFMFESSHWLDPSQFESSHKIWRVISSHLNSNLASHFESPKQTTFHESCRVT